MATGERYDEKRIIELLSQGNAKAFEQFYDHYRPIIYNASKKMVKSGEIAKEIVQDVFMDVWKRREQMVYVNNVRSYLLGMTRNIVSDHIREKINLLTITREFSFNARHENTTEKVMLEKQYQALLNEAIEQLPPQQRQVFNLVKTEGLSHEAIAKKLNLSRLTVKTHMAKALQSLRIRLQPHLTSFAPLAVILRIFLS